MKTIIQKSIEAGINLRGTRHAGKSAADLRRDNPRLAARWAKFIEANKAQLVREIAGVRDQTINKTKGKSPHEILAKSEN